MSDRLLLGLRRSMIPVPRFVWRRVMEANARRMRAGLRFMSDDHHRVRDFLVAELPRVGAPLPPERIARELALPIDRVRRILDQLEKRLMFLVRDAGGAVTWAYPVTVDQTPHRATLSTGEEAYSP